LAQTLFSSLSLKKPQIPHEDKGTAGTVTRSTFSHGMHVQDLHLLITAFKTITAYQQKDMYKDSSLWLFYLLPV